MQRRTTVLERLALVGLACLAACEASPHAEGADDPPDAAVEAFAAAEAGPVLLDHGYDAIRSPVTVAWDANADTATVGNDGRSPITVSLSLVAHALGEQDLAVDVGLFRLEAGEAVQTPSVVPLLPAQTRGAAVEAVLVAHVTRDGVPAVDVHSAPIRARFDETWALEDLEVVHGRPADVEAALQERSAALSGDGRFVAPDGSTTPLPDAWAAAGGPATAPFPPDPFPDPFPDPVPDPFPPLGTTNRVCPTWRAHYEDPNPSQDHLAAAGVMHVPASYAFITITTPWLFFPAFIPGTVVWEGYLDAQGCTPALELQGDYVYSLHSKLRRGGLDVEIQHSETATHLGYASGSFSSNPFGGTLRPITGDDHRATRVATVMSRLLVTDDLPIEHVEEDTLLIYADQPCPGSEFGACATGGRVYLGDNNFGEDMTLRRHVIAHEMGHDIMRRAIGFPIHNYNTGNAPEDQSLCRCDHVESSNALHCLQSREQLGAAFVEGFAQFTAAKVFNDPSEHSCGFSYYKEFLDPSGDVVLPPVTINCAIAARWMDTHDCVADTRGTEYDWMNFLWALNNGPNRLSLADVWDVVVGACWGSTCGATVLNWNLLEASAQASTTLSAAQRSWFVNAGHTYGVAH